MRKRPFFQYKTGAKESIEKLADVLENLRDSKRAKTSMERTLENSETQT